VFDGKLRLPIRGFFGPWLARFGFGQFPGFPDAARRMYSRFGILQCGKAVIAPLQDLADDLIGCLFPDDHSSRILARRRSLSRDCFNQRGL